MQPNYTNLTANTVLVAKPFLRLLKQLEEKRVPPERIQAILEAAVLPPGPSKRVQVVADFGELKDKKVESMAGKWVRDAAKQGTLEELRKKVDARVTDPPSIDTLVLLALIDLERKDFETAKSKLEQLTEYCDQSKEPLQRLAISSVVAIPAMEIPELKITAEPLYIRFSRLPTTTPSTSSFGSPFPTVSPRAITPPASSPSSQQGQTKLKNQLESVLAARASSYPENPTAAEVEWIKDITDVSFTALRSGEASTALDFIARVLDKDPSNPAAMISADLWNTVEESLRLQQAEPRYQMLANWILPTGSVRPHLRVVADYTIDQTSIDTAVSSASPATLVCNLHSLVRAAEAANKLEELRKRLRLLNHTNDPFVYVLRALAAMRAKDKAEVEEMVDAMIALAEKNELKPIEPYRTVTRSFTFTYPSHWSVYLIWQALLQDPEYDPLRIRLERHRLDLVGSIPLANLERARQLRTRIPSLDASQDPLQFLHWKAGREFSLSRNAVYGTSFDSSSLLYPVIPGVFSGYSTHSLTARYPIPERCTLEYVLPEYSGSFQISLAGNIVRLTSNQLTLSTIRGDEEPRKFSLTEHVKRGDVLTLERNGNKTFVRINQKLIADSKAFENAPWIGLGPHSETFITKPILRAEGKLPKRIALLGEQVKDGWVFYSSVRGNNQPFNRVSPSVTQATWELKERQLTSLDEPMHREAIGAIENVRGAFAGETIHYEFFYEPDAIVAHPYVDRTVFIIDPSGIEEIWQDQNLPFSRSLAKPVSNSSFQSSRSIPLKENDWNQVEVALHEGKLTLQINGRLAYERPWPRPHGSSFGFFKPQNRISRIRNVELSGHWPETLPQTFIDNPLQLNRQVLPSDALLRRELYGDTIAESQTRSIVRLAQQQEDPSAYQLLHDWVLPVSLQRPARCFAAGSIQQHDANGEQAILFCPAFELIRLAKKLNRLDALENEVQTLANKQPQEIQELNVLQLLINLQQRRLPEARQQLEKLLQLVRDPKSITVPRIEYLPICVAAWYAAEEPELQSLGIELIYAVNKINTLNSKIRSSSTLTSLTWFDPWLAHAQSMHSRQAPAPREGKSQWLEIPLLRPNDREEDFVNAWDVKPGNAVHYPRNTFSAITFQSPLQGSFSVEAKIVLNEAAPQFYFGKHGHYFSPANDLFQKWSLLEPPTVDLQRSSLPMRESVPGLIRYEINEKQIKTLIDNKLFTEFPHDPHAFPWLALRSSFWEQSPSDGCSVKISGNAQIPPSLDLLAANSLDGWNVPAQFITDYETNLSGESTPILHWVLANSRLIGKGNGSPLNVNRDSRQQAIEVLTYGRPLLEDADLELEFYYEQNRSSLAIAIGGVLFELSPSGLQPRALQPLPKSLIRIPNQIPELRESKPLPLQESDWNRIKLSLRGDELSWVINDTSVGKCTLSQPKPLRHLSLCYPWMTHELSVRKLIYQGNWPKQLPMLSDQILAPQ